MNMNIKSMAKKINLKVFITFFLVCQAILCLTYFISIGINNTEKKLNNMPTEVIAINQGDTLDKIVQKLNINKIDSRDIKSFILNTNDKKTPILKVGERIKVPVNENSEVVPLHVNQN